MDAHSSEILLADIGGTHARFALTVAGKAGPVEDLLVAGHPRVADALAAFLARRPGAKPQGAVLAGAGPVYDNRIAMTNSRWVIDGEELRQGFGLPWVRVINDFEALAWSLPDLGAANLHAIGGGAALEGKSTGGLTSRSLTAPWYSAGLGAHARLRLWRALHLEAGVEGAFSLTRPRFALSSSTDATQPLTDVFTVRPFVPTAALGLVVDL